jgi:hypothetical protein
MFTTNPFAAAAAAELVSPLAMRVYVILMAIVVAVGTLFDIYHKGSGKYFALRREKTRAAAKNRLSGPQRFTLALKTIAEAAVSGEFCKTPRRISHLLMMYGFLLYVITTVVMVFGYVTAAHTPTVLPVLWNLGALMILVGGLWFFFFLRVDVAYEGHSPFRLVRADLFVCLLLLSAALALVWHFVQTAFKSAGATLLFFGLYLLFTTLLFVTVPWSKFAHMFYKPAVAYQRRIEEASGASDLPAPADSLHCRN